MINNINSHKSYSGADVQRMAKLMVQQELRELLGKKPASPEWQARVDDLAVALANEALKETKHG